MEREESFFMDIQKSCRFGEFPGLQLFFWTAGHESTGLWEFCMRKIISELPYLWLLLSDFPGWKGPEDRLLHIFRIHDTDLPAPVPADL